MKVAVSYISSNYDFYETIKRIDESNADYLHMDIMDGKYVSNKTFNKKNIKYIFNNCKKLVDVHLMVINPDRYLKYFKNDLVDIIYFHPSTSKNIMKTIYKIKKLNKSVGLVINPDEDINAFVDYFSSIDNLLTMSVNPGAGGQEFIDSTINKISVISNTIKEKNQNILLAVDGGVNSETVKKIDKNIIDYVVSGSFICKSIDYNENINLLKEI